jgi:hypothetical protein
MKIGLMTVTTTIATDRIDILQRLVDDSQAENEAKEKKNCARIISARENSLLVSDPLKTK